MCQWYHYSFQDCLHVQAAAAIDLCPFITYPTFDPGENSRCEDVLNNPRNARSPTKSIEKMFREKCFSCTLTEIRVRIQKVEEELKDRSLAEYQIIAKQCKIGFEKKLLKLTQTAAAVQRKNKVDDKARLARVVETWLDERRRSLLRFTFVDAMTLSRYDPLFFDED